MITSTDSSSRLTAYAPGLGVTQQWEVRKPAARGRKGMVVSQSHAVSEVGVAVLENGGNAADAAVAMAFALTSAEPWNSGIGGVGFGLVRAPDGAVSLLDFGPESPRALDAARFPLTGDVSPDIFGWPRVQDDRNVHGPLSFVTPSAVAGYGLLHRTHGRLPREAVLAPAVALARRGLVSDWFTTVKIAQTAAMLRHYPESARIYLPNGLPPIPPEQGRPGHFAQGNLAQTLEQIRVEGYDSFYTGALAEMLLADFADIGAVIDRDDLRACRATLTAAPSARWRDIGTVYYPGERTAAPALLRIMQEMADAARQSAPDAAWFSTLGQVMRRTYAARLAGAAAGTDPLQAPKTCTTHLAVTDADGMTVSLTTTLLGLMGSGVVLPRTGVLMNNGVMWFDPRPGHPNSIAGNKRPLANMLPVLYVGDDGSVLAAGASGGRRILASVYQSLAFQLDFGMDVEAAAHQPRIDVSSPDSVGVDQRFAPADVAVLQAAGPIRLVEHAAAPLNFACPSFIRIQHGEATGVSDCMTPWSSALAVP